MTPSKALAGGFIAIILLGTVILMLPIASAKGQATGFFDALFTSTSAVCVIGKVLVDTGTYWSGFGQLIILLLMQIGGLGFMTLATLFAILAGRRLGIHDRMLAQETFGRYDAQDLTDFIVKIIKTSAIIEGIGFLLLLLVFVPIYGIQRGMWFSLFHSISAFCNAGFDVLGEFQSLTAFRGNFYLNGVISILAILGGLGFTVLYDLIACRKNLSRLSLHSKLVLSVSAYLLFGGTILFLWLESGNADSIGEAALFEKVLASFFQSMTTRTVGFETIPQGALTEGSQFVTILLMFIGGSPGSTAGGIKTTALAVAVLSMLAYVRRSDVQAFGRRIEREAVNKAIATTMIAFVLVLLSALMLSILNPHIEFLHILFEVVSAVGTAGMSTGITLSLTGFSKMILIALMFSGRIGTLTLVLALAGKEKPRKIHYPEGKVML